MDITIGKILAMVIFLALVALMIAEIVPNSQSRGELLFMILGLALIWFPDLGDVRGWVFRGGYIDTDSPPFLISFVGWIFLVGMPTLFRFL